MENNNAIGSRGRREGFPSSPPSRTLDVFTRLNSPFPLAERKMKPYVRLRVVQSYIVTGVLGFVVLAWAVHVCV